MFYILADGVQIYKPLDDLLMLFSPKLTLEIGKAGSLEFDIPPNNPFYDSMNQLTTEVTVEMDDEEIFHGRVLSCERTFSNIRHVYCEGDLSYLIDSVQKGVKFVGTTHQLFNAIISNHNSRVDNSKKFMVGTVNIENRSIILTGKSEGDQNINAGLIDYRQIAIDSIVDEWNNTFDYIQTCLIDYCGGYLRTRRVNGTMYIDLLADFGSNAVQPIELGRNMLDLTEEVSVDELFTVLIPLGDDNLTIAAVNGGSDELVDRGGVAKYGRIVRTHVFSNVNSPYTLLENARRYMATNINIPRTITVRAIDLHLVNKSINAIHIGDKVEITSFVHDVNDRLMCTKIEYDLENPENNSYTFGNPKQTLTQRYREDKRQSNSANSPTSASATGAAAAAATAKESEKETDKALKDFYDTWVEWDDETGKVSLGAFYKKYLGDRHVLVSQCGIDLDAETGNVDITSLHKNVTDQGRLISENNAAIKIVQEDTKALIDQTLDRVDHLADVESDHHTHITQKVDELSSSIELVAKNTSTSLEGMTESIATITQLADDQESRISQVAEYTRTIDGKTDTAIASITAVANELGSSITLKADVTYVDGLLEAVNTRISNLMSGNESVQNLLANNITANSIKLKVGTGTVDVVPSVHSHRIETKEGNNGEITISIGSAVTDEIPQQASFNIANTKYFRDHVAAAGVKIRSLDPDSYSTSGDYTVEFDNGFVRYTDGQMIGRVRITFENDEFKNAIVKIPGIRAYNAGVDAGAQTAEVKSIISNGPAGLPTYDSSDDVWYANIPITATAKGTKSDSSEYTSPGLNRSISVNVTSIYNKGKADGAEQGSHDVDFIFFDFDPDDPYWYSSSANNYYIPIKAVLENDVTKKSTFTISGQEARNSVSVTGVQYYTQTGEDTITYTDDNNRTLTAMVKVHLNNDDNNGQGFTKTVNIPGTLAYNAGRNSVTVVTNGLGLNTAWSESSTGYLYETGNKRFKVRVKAELNNTQVIGATIYIPAGEAWNAGKDAGAETATPTRANISAISNIQQDPYDDEVWYGTVSVTATAQGTYADGTKYSSGSVSLGTQQVNVTAAYQKGWDDAGGDDPVVVSIDGSMSTSSTNRATITASASCGSKSGSGSYAISMSRTNSTSTSVRVNVVDNNSKVLAYTTVSYPSSTIDHADAIRKGEKDVEFVQIGSDEYIAVVPVSVRTFNSSSSTTPFWTGDATVDITDAIEQYFYAVDIQSANYTSTTSQTYKTYNHATSLPLSTLYASSSIYYGRLEITLENGNKEIVRVSTPRVNKVERGTYSASERYSAALDYYKWTGSKGYVKAVAKSSNNEIMSADIDVTSLVQAAQESGGGGVSVRSLKALSNKTYDQSMDMYYVRVRVTMSDGSYNDYYAWYD